jgi:hypothetical protein
MAIKVPELRQMIRTMGIVAACQMITESLQASARGEIGHMRPSDFSIRDLAEGLVENGREWVQNMNPAYAGSSVMESQSAVDSTAFANITGQLLINEVLAAYESPAFTISQAFRVMSSRLSGERVPGMDNVGDKAETVNEGMPFPSVGFGENYIDTPVTTKRGLIIPVTKEAIFFDRTGLILEHARQVGESLGINKEKRCADLMIGAANNYKWKGTSYNTYQASTPWINLLAGASYDLVDWTDVDAAEALFDEMTDPATGEPINISVSSIFATPARKHALNRITNATEVRYTTPGFATTGNPTETVATNPMSGYTGQTSKWLYSRLRASGLTADQAKATWFAGDPSRAFRYVENWPMTVVQAPQNSEAEFNQDIVARFKASERGVAAVFDPRFMVKVNGYG